MRYTKYLRLPLPPNGSDNWSEYYWSALEAIDKMGGYITPSLDGTKVIFNTLNSNGTRIPVITAETAPGGYSRISIGKSLDEIWIAGKKYGNEPLLSFNEYTAGVNYGEGDSVIYMGLRFICLFEHISSDFMTDISYWKPLSRSVEIVTQATHGLLSMDVVRFDTLWIKANSASPENIPEPPIVVVDASDDVLLLSGPGLIHKEGLGNATYYLTTVGGVTSTPPDEGFSCPVYRSINNKWISILDARPLELM